MAASMLIYMTSRRRFLACAATDSSTVKSIIIKSLITYEKNIINDIIFADTVDIFAFPVKL